MPLSTAREKLFSLHIPKVQCTQVRLQHILGDCKSKNDEGGRGEGGRKERGAGEKTGSSPIRYTFM